MMLVRTFCCCCKLRTGAIMIGTLSLILSMTLLIVLIHAIQDRHQFKETYVGVVIVASITIIASLLLVIGAAKGYIWLLLSWLVIASLVLICIFVSAVYILVVRHTITTTGIIAVDVLCIFGGVVLGLYILIVVYSYFVELKKRIIEEGAEVSHRQQPYSLSH